MSLVFDPQESYVAVYFDDKFMGNIYTDWVVPRLEPSWGLYQLGPLEQCALEVAINDHVAMLMLARRLTS